VVLSAGEKEFSIKADNYRDKGIPVSDKGSDAVDKRLIASRIKERMEALGLTQHALQQRIGATQASVSRWLSAEHAPNARRLPELARALQTTTDYLTGRDEKAGSPEERILAAFNEVIKDLIAGRTIRQPAIPLSASMVEEITRTGPDILASLEEYAGAPLVSLSEAALDRLLEEVKRGVLNHIRQRPRSAP
jgi:transcriptional regulator with XRE-family HTH domain